MANASNTAATDAERREAYLAAVRFERPRFIPMAFHINDACWHHYPQEALWELMGRHPFLFPGFAGSPAPAQRPYVPRYARVARKDEPYRDDFGCVWVTSDDGITGTVKGHPLEDWAAAETYQAPDPERCMGIGPIDWAEEADRAARDKAAGRLVLRGLRHGHTFMQLCDIRGYENFLFDMADDDARLPWLIDLVEAFNAAIVKRYIALGAEGMTYAEDLGMQRGPMLSPANLRKYIKPSYRRLMRPALDKGLIVHMHSDGDIRELVDDLVDSGVGVVNLQDLVNGVDWIAARFRGRVCVELDIDRQSVTPFGTPAQVDALVREEVGKISTPQGGLMMIYGLYPGVPLANAAALMDAMERYAFFYD